MVLVGEVTGTGSPGAGSQAHLHIAMYASQVLRGQGGPQLIHEDPEKPSLVQGQNMHYGSPGDDTRLSNAALEPWSPRIELFVTAKVSAPKQSREVLFLITRRLIYIIIRYESPSRVPSPYPFIVTYDSPSRLSQCPLYPYQD